VSAGDKPSMCTRCFFARNQIKIAKRMKIWQMSVPEINSIFKEVFFYHEYSRAINKNELK
jgi:hypothetical protein